MLTSSFLYFYLNYSYSRKRSIKERFGEMSWTQYVRDHLLPRVAGFELLMAPYAIAHLKLSLFLQESGYEFDRAHLAVVGGVNLPDREMGK